MTFRFSHCHMAINQPIRLQIRFKKLQLYNKLLTLLGLFHLYETKNAICCKTNLSIRQCYMCAILHDGSCLHHASSACYKKFQQQNNSFICTYLTDFIRKFSHIFLNTSDTKPLGVENATSLQRIKKPIRRNKICRDQLTRLGWREELWK